jgi:hypothetical protein
MNFAEAQIAAAIPDIFADDSQVMRTHGLGDEAIPEGQRDSTLASLAGTMRHKGFPVEAIAAALHVVNTQRCRPPLADRDIEREAISQIAGIGLNTLGDYSGVKPSLEMPTATTIAIRPPEQSRRAVAALSVIGYRRLSDAFNGSAPMTAPPRRRRQADADQGYVARLRRAVAGGAPEEGCLDTDDAVRY